MTVEVDLAEFRAAYLVEMEELLATAETVCANLGRAIEDGAPARLLVRELLRAVHTMKGISAMMNAEPVVDLAHELEELLRAIDASDLALDDARLALAVETMRAVGERVAAMREGKPLAPVPTAWLYTLRDSLAGSGSGAAVAASPLLARPQITREGYEKLEAHERARLEGAASRGARAVVIDFVPSPAKAGVGLTIAKVRERLGDLMEIVRVLPLNTGAASNAGGLSFAIYGVATVADDVLATATGDAASAVTTLFERAARLEASTDPSEAEVQAPAIPARASSQLRVDPRRVDDAIDRVSAMLVTRSRLELALARLDARDSSEGRGRSLESKELGAILQESARQLRDARGSLLRLRMVPTTDLLDRMPLLLRDLKRASAKLARLEPSGGHTELDKVVADKVFPALVHLLRNAFDHGVEAPADRRAAGKPEEACIEIAFRSTSNGRIELRIADDGRGVDVGALCRAAGVPAPAAGVALGDAEILALMCRPGLSTKAEASRASGRGMGMDIVRKIIVEELGGAIALSSQAGVGTTFVVDLPLTVAVLDGFRVRAGGEVFVVPVALVDEILDVDPASVVTLPSRVGTGARRSTARLLAHRTGPMALVDVASLLGVQTVDGQGGRRQALVVRRAGEPIAFVIDRVLGQVETVVRPLEDPLVRVPCFSGSTDLGDGRARLVLDLLALAVLAARPAPATAEARPS